MTDQPNDFQMFAETFEHVDVLDTFTPDGQHRWIKLDGGTIDFGAILVYVHPWWKPAARRRERRVRAAALAHSMGVDTVTVHALPGRHTFYVHGSDIR